MSLKDTTIKTILKKTELSKKNFLDLGPGSGRWLDFVKKFKPNRIFAADISLEIKKKCINKVDEFRINDFEKGKIDFKSNSMDIIMIIEVLEHVRNYELFLKEIIRISKNGGILIFTMPNILSFISRIRVVFGLLPVAIASDETHVNFFRKKDINRIFKKFNQDVNFYNSTFSLNPFKPKSKLRVKSIALFGGLDDSFIFTIRVKK